jgi:hypothetical protein
MALLTKFDTPANLKDVPASSPFYSKWSSFISGVVGNTLKGDVGTFNNPTKTDIKIIGEKTLTWMGFSRELYNNSANGGDRRAAFAAAEADLTQRLPQIEYFEWKTDRVNGKVTKVTFVTETADYYNQLWLVDRAAVVKLYKQLVNPAVVEADLHTKGKYNKFNKWNTTDGIVHYIHPVNSFNDAIGLARDGVKSEPPFRDNYEARPALFNRPTSADPRISYDTHMLIRKGYAVSIKNPIGLYIVGWENAGITNPDGSPAGNYWKIVRGVPGMVLRLEYEVPTAQGFVVGDLKIGGRPIEFGSQLAEHITVGFTETIGTVKK